MKNYDGNFFKDVHEVVRLVPKGRVTTYGAIGKYLGLKSSARMVGWAMNASIGVNDVPAHRVVNQQGLLSGKMHFPTPDYMQEKLESEGVKIKDDKVVDLEFHFWDPTKELI